MNGLTVIENYIGEVQASLLMDKLATLFKDEDKRARNIKRFGSRTPYTGDYVGPKIPTFINSVIDSLVFDDLMREPDHVTVNLYLSGQDIPYHVDSPTSGEKVVVLSVGGDAVMLLRHGKDKSNIEEVPLPSRSLLLLSGEARWDWQHSIMPVKDRRYSLVFRKSN